MKLRASGFPAFTLRRLARTTSTQNVVRAAARAGANEGFCCVAGEQTEGRGRQGRTWIAPPGASLLASLLLRRRPLDAPGIPIAAGLAIIEALLATARVDAQLKWPNDVVVRGGKLAGLLAEVEPAASTSEQLAIVLGIGLNLRVPEWAPGIAGVSLHQLTRHIPTADEVLAAWLEGLAARLDVIAARGLEGLRDEWRRHATGLGEVVTAQTGAGEVVGVAEDIDRDGALIIRTSAGVTRLFAGDVHLTQPQASQGGETPSGRST